MRNYHEPKMTTGRGRPVTHSLAAKTSKFLEQIPDEKKVVVSPDAGPDDMLLYLNAIHAFVNDVSNKLASRLDPFMSRYIGDYVNMASKVTEAKSLIIGNALEPPRVGDLSEEQIRQYRYEYAEALTLGMTQLRVLHEYAKAHDVVGKTGKIQFWAAESLVRLVGGIYSGIMRYAKLMAWENRNLANPMHDPVARVAEVTGLVVERAPKGRRWIRRRGYDPLADNDGRGD